jgi:hypothetical protein
MGVKITYTDQDSLFKAVQKFIKLTPEIFDIDTFIPDALREAIPEKNVSAPSFEHQFDDMMDNILTIAQDNPHCFELTDEAEVVRLVSEHGYYVPIIQLMSAGMYCAYYEEQPKDGAVEGDIEYRRFNVPTLNTLIARVQRGELRFDVETFSIRGLK